MPQLYVFSTHMIWGGTFGSKQRGKQGDNGAELQNRATTDSQTAQTATHKIIQMGNFSKSKHSLHTWPSIYTYKAILFSKKISREMKSMHIIKSMCILNYFFTFYNQVQYKYYSIHWLLQQIIRMNLTGSHVKEACLRFCLTLLMCALIHLISEYKPK